MVVRGNSMETNSVQMTSFFLWEDNLCPRLNGGKDEFTPLMQTGDGVMYSEKGRVRMVYPNDESFAMTNVGHVYLWKITPGNSNRQSWQLLSQGDGYIFYNDFDGGQWLKYRDEDDTLICAALKTDATVWKISPAPDPALLQGKVP